MKRNFASSFLAAALCISLMALLSPASGVPLPDLGGGGTSPSPSASPSVSPSKSPTPTPAPSPSLSASPTPLPTSSPTPTSSPAPAPTARPLLEPIAPLNSSIIVVVPQKFSNVSPQLLRVPETWRNSDRRSSITNRSWCKKPKELLANVYVGGNCKIEILPLAAISRGQSSEVQTLVFTPTRVLLNDFPKNTSFGVTLRKPNGKLRNIGDAKTDSSGQIALVPLTLGKSASYVVIDLQWQKKKRYSFLMRAIN